MYLHYVPEPHACGFNYAQVRFFEIREEADAARRRLEEEASSLIIELAKVRDENANLSSKVSDADEQIRALNAEKHSSQGEVEAIKEKVGDCGIA